jgi:hypothetical protein
VVLTLKVDLSFQENYQMNHYPAKDYNNNEVDQILMHSILSKTNKLGATKTEKEEIKKETTIITCQISTCKTSDFDLGLSIYCIRR